MYAVGVVAQKPALRYGSPLAVTWLACAIGAICCLPFAPRARAPTGPRAARPPLAWTVYLGLVPTAIGFSTWAYALARTDAGKLGSTTYLVPPIAVLLGLDHAGRGAAAHRRCPAGSSASPASAWRAGPPAPPAGVDAVEAAAATPPAPAAESVRGGARVE